MTRFTERITKTGDYSRHYHAGGYRLTMTPPPPPGDPIVDGLSRGTYRTRFQAEQAAATITGRLLHLGLDAPEFGIINT